MAQADLRSKITLGALAAVLAMASLLGGCGGGDEDGDAETVTDSPVPSTGVAVAPPERVAQCLRRRGFEAEAEDESDLDGEGAEARLALGGSAEVPGSGRITYYESEERAFEANSEELAEQQPNSLIGRTGEAVYVFASAEDLEPARQAILGCL